MEYKIIKPLSNNVVLANKEDKNYVLLGKGIGFGKKKNMILKDSDNIEKIFISLDDFNLIEYENLLSKVDPKILELTERIISMVSKELKENLNPHIHIGLIDHINFAIKRLEEGIEIVNPFLFETKLLYPQEYKLAEKAVNILRENLNIKIPDAEIGFITFHIYGARKNKVKRDAFKNSKIVSKIIDYTQRKLQIDLSKGSFDYIRFVMHLKGVLNRLNEGKCIENVLLQKVKDEFKYEYKIAYDISKIIENDLRIKVPDDEIGYIALHLHKLKKYPLK
ncbi:BglG family transcription antiterminator [Caldisalinibacter kiritimatiensis]|uniref:Beta-glucoside bgl operon antiterminator, BglG family n=1 Tax=Caldisalinibacter kiritimatiensis TaxID=1304284 RepID=R1AWH2_9FIRM|nr:PRD domain-containing protein [Caldisalinibacter kiritimatiensis]EOD01498.1 Beta-glucoside bgl operon antiterminator, BglG family [Caldisalinibacter kiritimatiensis]